MTAVRINDPQFSNRRSLARASLFLALLVAPACAGRRQPVFSPASVQETESVLAAWQSSVERAELGPARLLYEARVAQGPFRTSGTLAVREGARSIDATLAGPFGEILASYSGGKLTGKGIKPITVDPSDLRWLLAGAWKGASPPFVGGTDGDAALLRWNSPERVEAVFDSANGRLRTLEVRRREAAIRASYPEPAQGRPRRIDLEDLGSGNTMRLTLLAAEPLTE